MSHVRNATLVYKLPNVRDARTFSFLAWIALAVNAQTGLEKPL